MCASKLPTGTRVSQVAQAPEEKRVKDSRLWAMHRLRERSHRLPNWKQLSFMPVFISTGRNDKRAGN